MSLVDVAVLARAELDRRGREVLYRGDPVLWAEEFLGVQLWSKQREILWSLRDNRNTAVAAGHGVGKSFVAAVAIAWWVATHPVERTFVATTAPSSSQLGIVWDTLRRMHGLAQRRFEEGLVDFPLPGYITGDHKWKAEDGTLIGEGRAPRVETIDSAFQGRHADYLLAVGDEAVGLSQGHLDALGNIATGSANRQLLIANPTDPSCAMAQIWHRELSSWNRLHISVFDSPAVTGEAGFDMSGDVALSGQDYIDEVAERWGVESAYYVARVTGEWAFESDSLLFSAEQLARASDTVVVPFDDEFPQHGWDISADGPDFTVGYELRRGFVWEVDDFGKPVRETDVVGFRVRRVGRWNKVPLVTLDSSKVSSASRIHELAVERAAHSVIVDTDGIGISVVNGVASLVPDYNLVEFRGNGKPSEVNVSAYENVRAEMYFLLRDDMILGRVDLDSGDVELFDELSGIQYEETVRGRLKIESKREMRSRGMKSPDHADACIYARFPVEVLVSGLSSLSPGEEVVVDPWDFVEGELEWGAPGVLM